GADSAPGHAQVRHGADSAPGHAQVRHGADSAPGHAQVRHGANSISAGLPDFPWDLLAPAKARAAAHPAGLVDLSIGTPVDPVPAVIQRALAAAADSPGYPVTAGTPALREALVGYVRRECGATLGEDGVLPTIGSKELVASLPFQLGLRPGDTVVIPRVCYPTYEVGARLAGANVERADSPEELSGDARLVAVNSPRNPHGRVLPA